MILKEFLKKIETTPIYQFEVKYINLQFDKVYSKLNEDNEVETHILYKQKSLCINTSMNIYNTLIFMDSAYYLYRYVIDASFDSFSDKKELIITLVYEEADIDKTYRSQYLENQQLKIEKLINDFNEVPEFCENNEPLTVKRLKEILQNKPDDSIVTFLTRFSGLHNKLDTVAIYAVTDAEGKIVLMADNYYCDINQPHQLKFND